MLKSQGNLKISCESGNSLNPEKVVDLFLKNLEANGNVKNITPNH